MKSLFVIILFCTSLLHAMSPEAAALDQEKLSIISNNPYILNNYFYAKSYDRLSPSSTSNFTSPDGRWLVRRADSNLIIHNTHENSNAPIIKSIASSRTNTIIFSPSSRFMAYKPTDETITICDLINQEATCTIVSTDEPKMFAEHGEWVRIITEGGRNNNQSARPIQTWDIATGQCIHSFETDATIWYSPHSKLLAYAHNSATHGIATMMKLQQDSGENIFEFDTNNIAKAIFSPDEACLATLSSDETTASIISTFNGYQLHTIKVLDDNGYPQKIKKLFFTPDHQHFIAYIEEYYADWHIPLIGTYSPHQAGIIKIWKLNEFGAIPDLKNINLVSGLRRFGRLNISCITANNRFVYVGMHSNPGIGQIFGIERWDLATGYVSEVRYFKEIVDRIWFSSNNEQMFAETITGRMYVWNSPLTLSQEQLELLVQFDNTFASLKKDQQGQPEEINHYSSIPESFLKGIAARHSARFNVTLLDATA